MKTIKKLLLSNSILVIVSSALVFTLSGCATMNVQTFSLSGNATDKNAVDISSINASGIKLYFTSPHDKEYTEIDCLKVLGTYKYKMKETLQALQSKAASMGADAVFNVTITNSFDRAGSIAYATGVAVKYK